MPRVLIVTGGSRGIGAAAALMAGNLGYAHMPSSGSYLTRPRTRPAPSSILPAELKIKEQMEASRAAVQVTEISTEIERPDEVLAPSVLKQIRRVNTSTTRHNVLLNLLMSWRRPRAGSRVLLVEASEAEKTTAAGLLGKDTGRKVYRVDISAVESKYIGETEKNLSKIFNEARRSHWILFFDEADALFGKRTEVKDAHDRYANQETSYLRQRIEDYDGLVVLASRSKSNLDPAFLRRLRAVIEFPPQKA